ncbi:porin family protein [Jannaschia sp. CCS1]|uniref:porin family protein n=1 Tax=Jannaschia sp. (strain CCS1) TaxID=290400 RepID=UPI000053DD42|nr:porin family protein [Jannaschia sp. CCS1]ABD55895.1 outer membrane protein putative [Jannaschia sp. CCS1]
MQFFRTMTCVALVGVGAPASAQNTDWSGFYAGGQLEFATADLDNMAGTTLNEGQGLMIGASGGYRFDGGDVVFGVTGAALFGSTSLEPVVPAATPDPTLDMLLRAGIEIGYDLGPVLVTGGLGQTFGVMTDATNSRRTEFGSYFAIGADYMVSDEIMVGAEITRTNLDNFAGSDLSVTSFGIGAAYRF